MQVLAFRHVPFEGAGLIESTLARRGITLEYVDLYRPEADVPAIDRAAGLIFLGGPMSVNDPLPFLDIERRIIAKAIDRAQPVLGICLGSQLIAQTLGAKVYRHSQKEIGWFEIRLTADGVRDLLLCDLPASQAFFHWHGDIWDLPQGATLLASSAICPNQAFRFGSITYGLQFHPEVTPEMIADWCLQDENCGDVRGLEAPIDPHRDAERLARLAEAIFGRWCDLLLHSRTANSTALAV